MELVKPWTDGGSLSVSYDGYGDGSAVFTSDTNEGIDREMNIFFVGGGSTINRVVKQGGRREVFTPSDGEFALKNEDTFNVLKGGL